MSATVHVRFTQPGFHRWPDAPDRRAYLRHAHRHLFHVEVSVDVHHDDREIEFHDLLDMARMMFGVGDGTWSCERMAANLGERLSHELGRDVAVSVWEDGECGATVKKKRPAEAGRLVGADRVDQRLVTQ